MKASKSCDYGSVQDLEADGADKDVPQPWVGILSKGAGQLEYQGFEDWTPEEKQLWRSGKLRSKWGVGQVSIRLPLADNLTIVALFYGFIPYIIPIWWAIWVSTSWAMNGHPRFFPAFGLCVALGCAIVNELITKQFCRLVLPESLTDRPPEAVCRHPGMPSGHVLNGWILMVWCLVEAATAKLVQIEWLIIIVACMGPVPWARWYNKDHTLAQVTVSMVLSIFFGVAAAWVRKTHYPNQSFLWHWYNTDMVLASTSY